MCITSNSAVIRSRKCDIIYNYMIQEVKEQAIYQSLSKNRVESKEFKLKELMETRAEKSKEHTRSSCDSSRSDISVTVTDCCFK